MPKSELPLADEVNELLREFRRLVRDGRTESNEASIRFVLGELSAVLAATGPVREGIDSLSPDEREVFLVWEHVVATALGMSSTDSTRLSRRVARARQSRVESSGSSIDLPGAILQVAGAWHLLSSTQKSAVSRAVRDGAQARMLGFANGLIQNEPDVFAGKFADLLWAIGRCIATRVAEEWDDLRSDRKSWRRILDPFSEQSMFGARVVLEQCVASITSIIGPRLSSTSDQ